MVFMRPAVLVAVMIVLAVPSCSGEVTIGDPDSYNPGSYSSPTYELDLVTKLTVDSAACSTIQDDTGTFSDRFKVAVTDVFSSGLTAASSTYALFASVTDVEIVNVSPTCKDANGYAMVSPYIEVAASITRNRMLYHYAGIASATVTLKLLDTSAGAVVVAAASSNPSPNAGVIAGAVVSGIAALVLLAGAGFFIYSRRKAASVAPGIAGSGGSGGGGAPVPEPSPGFVAATMAMMTSAATSVLTFGKLTAASVMPEGAGGTAEDGRGRGRVSHTLADSAEPRLGFAVNPWRYWD
ncbi:hypothetical protein FOA52_009689 [Chlamydomonas sp. UWO 241]|nr:hypothetical protein FOA52_009689 [Chlamydomonas sp. UWO 241]